MNPKYYYKNIEPLEEKITDYIEEKLASIEKILDILDIKIELSNRKENNKVFMSVKVYSKKGEKFQAKNHGTTFYECIDIIEEELKKQIRRSKEKNRDLTERGARSIKKKLTIDDGARL
ncbi:MAG: HPF/RaiA family ribosome-associated protein [Candidatus Moranbacteria bacterium]|nr:HPF/RaiA family ribosome-associated protein [Candidatus Moranbacteria bacterium]